MFIDGDGIKVTHHPPFKLQFESSSKLVTQSERDVGNAAALLCPSVHQFQFTTFRYTMLMQCCCTTLYVVCMLGRGHSMLFAVIPLQMPCTEIFRVDG